MIWNCFSLLIGLLDDLRVVAQDRRVDLRIVIADPELVRYTAWAMRVYMAGIFSTGFQVSCQQSFVALGQAKISLFMACLRKLILLIPLIFILPLILQDKVFAVFLAEPVSDIIAATVTCSAFFIRFNKILATSQKKA